MHCIHCKLCIDFHIFVQYPLFYFIDAFLMFVFFIFSFSTSSFFLLRTAAGGFHVYSSLTDGDHSVGYTNIHHLHREKLPEGRLKRLKAHCVITVQWVECCSRIVGVIYEDVCIEYISV